MAKTAHWLFDQKHNGEKLLFSLFLLFLPTQLGKHFWPTFSYLLGIRSDYLSPTLYFTDIIILGLFVVWIWNKKQELRIKNYGRKIYLFICLFMYLFISILFSNNILLGFYGLWKLAECLFIALYIAKRSGEIISFAQMIFLLSIGGIFESLLAILQFINQGSLNGIFYFFGERTFTSQTIGIANMSLNGTELLRPYATFSHPNVLAGYLLIISTLTLYASFKKNKAFSLPRLYYLLVYFFCTFALFITYARIAILCWVFTTLIFVFLQLKKEQKIVTIGLSVCLLALLFFISWHLQLLQRFTSLTLTDESVTQRENLLLASWQLFSMHPLFGVGLNSFLPSLSQLPMLQLNFFLLQPVHNIFVLVAVELGLVGLIVFIWFIGKTIYKNFKNWQQESNRLSFSFLCLILLLQIIFTGMFDHYWLTLQQGQLLFALVLGMCWNKCFS